MGLPPPEELAEAEDVEATGSCRFANLPDVAFGIVPVAAVNTRRFQA